MMKTIFYSWQSDLPSNINRGFILDCLERAVKAIASDGLSVDFEIDRDTLDVSGSPDIVATILRRLTTRQYFLQIQRLLLGPKTNDDLLIQTC
jgi:hypothetical protein